MTKKQQKHYDLNAERIENQFLIDRRGNIKKYKDSPSSFIISVHEEIAKALYPDKLFALDYLVESGWLVVGSKSRQLPYTNKEITRSQIDRLKAINEMRYVINDEVIKLF